MGTIEWEGTAERVAFHAPYILLFDSRFIEIRHIETGRLAQIIPGSDVRCIWDGRGVSTGAVLSSHDDSQEAQVHVVMNATDSTNGPGALKNKSIMQHVCELIPTVQLFPSDTNSTMGTAQDVAAANTSYVVTPQSSVPASPTFYAPSAHNGFTSPGGVYTTNYVTSPTDAYPSSNNHVYPVSNNHVYPSSNNHVYPSPNNIYPSNNVYPSPNSVVYSSPNSAYPSPNSAYPSPNNVYPSPNNVYPSPNILGAPQAYPNAANQYVSSDLSSGSGGRGGNVGYFPAAGPSQPPELYSRSWRPS